MEWSGLGGSGWTFRLRELEFSVRRMFRISRKNPEGELPQVDLSDAEQKDAVRLEAARRVMMERT